MLKPSCKWLIELRKDEGWASATPTFPKTKPLISAFTDKIPALTDFLFLIFCVPATFESSN